MLWVPSPPREVSDVVVFIARGSEMQHCCCASSWSKRYRYCTTKYKEKVSLSRGAFDREVLGERGAGKLAFSVFTIDVVSLALRLQHRTAQICIRINKSINFWTYLLINYYF